MKSFNLCFLFIIINLIFVTGCLREEELEMVAPKLSINCLFTPDSYWNLTATKGAGGGAVKTLQIFVCSKEHPPIPLRWDSDAGAYLNEKKRPEEGVKYELAVVEDDELTILSESTIPPRGTADNIRAIRTGNEICILFDIQCNEGIPYYSIQVTQDFSKHTFIHPIQKTNFDFDNQNEEAGLGYSYIIATNHQLSKKDLSIRLQANRIKKGSPLVLSIESCSEDAGKYRSTLQRYSLNKSSMIFSNIRNGLGIFGAYNKTRYSLSVEEPQ